LRLEEINMTQVLSSHISDHAITFFANGKLHSVQSDHPGFAHVRELLLSTGITPVDADELIEIIDVRVAIAKAAESPTYQNVLEFDGDNLMYRGAPLHGVWVDKILAFREKGYNFEPIFKALESLLKNPSGRARDRFSIFAERSQFGFLPDGRMGAFKAVRGDFTDLRTGTFDNSPGKTVEMVRADVNDDPEQACSYGLHLGAMGYVRTFGHWDGSRANKVVFCAFWPEDVVAVPVDYDGEKMRVCKYEVIEEVDPASVDAHLAARTTLISEEAINAEVDGSTGSEPELSAADRYADGYDAGWNAKTDGDDFVIPTDPDEARGYRRGWSDCENNNGYDDSDPLNPQD
jgi:hypothetical protein